MNTNTLVIAFIVLISAVIWFGMDNNDSTWEHNVNSCVGECYEQWQADHGGSIVEQEVAKQAAMAAASPAALGEAYFGQCIACHGANGEGGIGPQLAGQTASEIVAKLTAYRAGETRNAQSALMWPVAKPMSDADIDNVAAYVSAL